MFPDSIYQPIYLIIVSIFTIFFAFICGKMSTETVSAKKDYGNGVSLFVCFALIVFIGTRPIRAFADTGVYTSYYEAALGMPFVFSIHTPNILFDNLLLWFASKEIPITFFYIFISTVYFGALYAACRKLFPEFSSLALFVYLGAFSTFSYGVNGIKAGAAASLFLLALASMKDHKLLFVLLAVASWGLHHSMVVVIVTLVVSSLYKNTKHYFYFWIICLLIAAAHISVFQSLFAEFLDEKSAGYLLADENDEYAWITGFRPDFILYSAAPIVIGYWLIFKRKIRNQGYEQWLRLYILNNSLWMLCMYASYTNRIAYLSWFMYPIVLIYPFISFIWDNKQLLYAKRAALCHLGFTLFMVLVYYR